MIDMDIFKEAPSPVSPDLNDKVDELVEWFMETFPDQDLIDSDDLYRAARDYVLVYC